MTCWQVVGGSCFRLDRLVSSCLLVMLEAELEYIFLRRGQGGVCFPCLAVLSMKGALLYEW
jgi:hypothetical protein